MAKKKRFSIWRPSAMLNLKIFHIRSHGCHQYAVMNQISSQSDDFSLRYGHLTIFKMAPDLHFEL